MKPLHVGLLVIGAALAGGLAVRMSQAPAVQVSAAAAPMSAPPAPAREIVKPQPPMETVAAVTAPAPQVVTPAPKPVYEAPVAAAAKRKPFTAVIEAPRRGPVTLARVAPMPIASAPYLAPAPDQAPPPAPKQAEPNPAPEPQPEVAHAAPVVVERAASEPRPEPRKVTLYQGAQISIRLDQSLSTDRIANGDPFQASLADPLVADGLVIAERGARVTGRVVNAQRAGRLSGAGAIELALSTVQTADGQRIAITTEPWAKQSESRRNSEATKIGGGAALGAIIGAIAGGGAGAAIGAGAGAAAGTGAAAASGGRGLDIPSESVLRFRLAGRVTITERAI